MNVLAVHADWSVNPSKRWMTVARGEAGGWHIAAPEPVGDPATLPERLLARAAGGAVALGVDFPLGLPASYAALRGITDFPAWLKGLDPDDALFTPCRDLDEVTPARPFYPRGTVAGKGQLQRQAAMLGLADVAAMRRAVDFRTARRPAGAPLFWTMGANQCGKAALSGWREMVMPAMARGTMLRLWPFEGGFAGLVAPGTAVIAETYPAEAMVQTKLKLAGSKRRQADRARLGPALMDLCTHLHCTTAPDLATRIADGFGPSPDAEDPFDSLLGVLGTIRVLAGAPDGTESGFPGHAPDLRAIEGWVLGQTDPPIRL